MCKPEIRNDRNRKWLLNYRKPVLKKKGKHLASEQVKINSSKYLLPRASFLKIAFGPVTRYVHFSVIFMSSLLVNASCVSELVSANIQLKLYSE